MTNLVAVKSFSGRVEAQLAQAKLKAEGIESTISGQDAGGALPLQSLNTRLLVNEEYSDRAIKILEND